MLLMYALSICFLLALDPVKAIANASRMVFLLAPNLKVPTTILERYFASRLVDFFSMFANSVVFRSWEPGPEAFAIFVNEVNTCFTSKAPLFAMTVSATKPMSPFFFNRSLIFASSLLAALAMAFTTILSAMPKVMPWYSGAISPSIKWQAMPISVFGTVLKKSAQICLILLPDVVTSICWKTAHKRLNFMRRNL